MASPATSGEPRIDDESNTEDEDATKMQRRERLLADHNLCPFVSKSRSCMNMRFAKRSRVSSEATVVLRNKSERAGDKLDHDEARDRSVRVLARGVPVQLRVPEDVAACGPRWYITNFV